MNRTKKIILMIVWLLFLFLLTNCAQTRKTNLANNSELASFEDFLDISELSNHEKINSTDLDVYISNKTDDCVVFPYDYGVQIFALVDETWVEVSNLVDFANKTDVILSSSSDINLDAIVGITPDYSNLNGLPQKVRVVLNATLCKDGAPSNEMVSDYIDIDLEK